MKPDYNIGARNGLLEGKHMQALGMAMWLYLWFLDKQPKNSDKVLGGRPVTYKMFAQSFPNVPRSTYVRWLAVIEIGEYIELLRTPRGYVVSINKPKKWLKSDVPPIQHHNESSRSKSQKKEASDVALVVHHEPSDVPNLFSDVAKMEHAEDVAKMEHPIKRDSLKLQETTKNNTTNVVLGADAPKRYGKPEINEMFDLWQQTIGYAIEGSERNNRRACSNLLKKHGSEKLQRFIHGVALALDDPYAPRIADFVSLQEKLNALLSWGRKKGFAHARRGVDLTE